MHCQRLTLTWTNRSGISIQLLSISLNRLHERFYESFIAIRNSPLLNYWESIILSQLINETYVSLPLKCSNSKEV